MLALLGDAVPGKRRQAKKCEEVYIYHYATEGAASARRDAMHVLMQATQSCVQRTLLQGCLPSAGGVAWQVLLVSAVQKGVAVVAGAPACALGHCRGEG